MCLVAGVESPSLPSETARLARPAGRLRRGALSGTTVKCILLTIRGSPPNVFHSHLPVKSMLFHCNICSHGGHQNCYTQFYAKMPLVLLPTPLVPSTFKPQHRVTRSTSRSNDGEGDDTNATFDCSFDTSTVTPASSSQLFGHPCAAGCGHFCWVANLSEDTEKP